MLTNFQLEGPCEMTETRLDPQSFKFDTIRAEVRRPEARKLLNVRKKAGRIKEEKVHCQVS